MRRVVPWLLLPVSMPIVATVLCVQAIVTPPAPGWGVVAFTTTGSSLPNVTSVVVMVHFPTTVVETCNWLVA